MKKSNFESSRLSEPAWEAVVVNFNMQTWPDMLQHQPSPSLHPLEDFPRITCSV